MWRTSCEGKKKEDKSHKGEGTISNRMVRLEHNDKVMSEQTWQNEGESHGKSEFQRQ